MLQNFQVWPFQLILKHFKACYLPWCFKTKLSDQAVSSLDSATMHTNTPALVTDDCSVSEAQTAGQQIIQQRLLLKTLWSAFLEEDYKYKPNASYLTTYFLN